jgi:SAM-dependent MidA family methyltransferase
MLNFAEFMGLALYHPTLGYYRRARNRVGYGPNTDFYTASTSGAVFGELVVAACVQLLGNRSPSEFTLVEIGAEPSSQESSEASGVLTDVKHPFAQSLTLRVGERLDLSGRCIVFSNELFDAQPFRRFQFRDGAWRELGVALAGDHLTEVELPIPVDETALAHLPPSPDPGYVFDAPFAAATLIAEIARQPWSGLFVACDYGKSWAELSEACPAGTARAYHRHVQSNDLLARPGEQDLTCHICWDWLNRALIDGGFPSPELETQESFFIRRSTAAIEAMSTRDAAHFSPRKLSLLQLLHPSHLGQKFQVLHASRFD